MTRKLGPNMKRFLAYKMAKDSMPSPIDVLLNPAKLAQIARDALKWCEQAIDVMRSTPDNPYGNDEESIAGAILAELEKRDGHRG